MPDIQFITSWLKAIDGSRPEIQFSQNTSAVSYPTPSLSSYCFANSTRPVTDTKRRTMDMTDEANVETSRAKRPKRAPKSVQSFSTGSTSSLLDSHLHLSHHSQPKATCSSRSSSPKRDLLNQLRCATPSIDWQPLRDTSMPDSVKGLLFILTADFGSKVIPRGLKVGCPKGTSCHQRNNVLSSPDSKLPIRWAQVLFRTLLMIMLVEMSKSWIQFGIWSMPFCLTQNHATPTIETRMPGVRRSFSLSCWLGSRQRMAHCLKLRTCLCSLEHI